MTSPEKEGDQPPEVRLSFVFGNTAVTFQTPRAPPEDPVPPDPAEPSSPENLRLSRAELNHVPESILKNSTLKYLCLEGNLIFSIPQSMFVSLPNLRWLDLRRNQIVSLPPEIGSHRCLRTLLLEGNPISELPAELGNVISLRGLNLRDCPIRVPPQEVLHQGVGATLQHLRTVLAQRPLSVRKTPVELPVVEKLHLSELTGHGVEEREDSVDEDDLQRFRELKEKLILLDIAELSSMGHGDYNPNFKTLSLHKRPETVTRTDLNPELPPFPCKQWRRREGEKAQEAKEKQALLEQKRKSQAALQKWRERSKEFQQKKMLELKKKKLEKQRQLQKEASLEDDVSAPLKFDTFGEEFEEDRSAQELERQIHSQVEKMQERNSDPTRSAAEQVAAAAKDVEEMKKLRAPLLERRKNLRKHLENTFTIFTADTWPSFADK